MHGRPRPWRLQNPSRSVNSHYFRRPASPSGMPQTLRARARPYNPAADHAAVVAMCEDVCECCGDHALRAAAIAAAAATAAAAAALCPTVLPPSLHTSHPCHQQPGNPAVQMVAPTRCPSIWRHRWQSPARACGSPSGRAAPLPSRSFAASPGAMPCGCGGRARWRRCAGAAWAPSCWCVQLGGGGRQEAGVVKGPALLPGLPPAPVWAPMQQCQRA